MAQILLQQNLRAVKVEVLPDMRKRTTRRYDVVAQQEASKTTELFDTQIKADWGAQDELYPQCRLIGQDFSGQVDQTNVAPNKEPPYLIRVFEEIAEEAETPVGNADVTIGQDDITTVVQEYLQFSYATSIYQVPGVTPAPSPFDTTCVLQNETRTNDGTLQRIKRTYVSAGLLTQTDETKFDGGLLVRTLTYLRTTPPTPTGYTLINKKQDFVNGCPVITSTFACGKVSAGAGGQIAIDIEYAYSPDQGTTGITWQTIKYITDPSVVANPISTPGGYVLVQITEDNQDGWKLWTGRYAKGTGTIQSDIDIREGGNLIIYTKVAINAPPSAPSPTIGGTVVAIEEDQRNGTRFESGTVVYTWKWAEGNGTIDTDTQGEPDGALVTTLVTLSAAASTPTSPGAGWYLINLDQKAGDGYYINRAVYKKPPVSKTFKKTTNFSKPGSVVISGSPPQLVYNSPVTMTVLADVVVDYDTSQITDVPFSVVAYGTFYFTYTPTATGVPISGQQAIGGYLCGASGNSGTNSVFNGVLCDSWSYQLGSSTPSSFTAAVHVLHTENDPYLTAVDGTVVYRRTKVSYDFS